MMMMMRYDDDNDDVAEAMPDHNDPAARGNEEPCVWRGSGEEERHR